MAESDGYTMSLLGSNGAEIPFDGKIVLRHERAIKMSSAMAHSKVSSVRQTKSVSGVGVDCTRARCQFQAPEGGGN